MDRSGCVRTKQITSWRKLMIKMSRKNVTQLRMLPNEEKESNFLNSFKSRDYSWFNSSYIRQHSSTLSHLLSLFLIINSCCFNYKKAYVCWKVCVTRSSNKTHRNVSCKTKRLERHVYPTPCWEIVVILSIHVNQFQIWSLSRPLGLFFLPCFFFPEIGSVARIYYLDSDVLLTVHLSIFILIINQLDAQNLFYNKLISCLYMFRAPCAHRQEVKIVLYILWYHHTYRWPSRARNM